MSLKQLHTVGPVFKMELDCFYKNDESAATNIVTADSLLGSATILYMAAGHDFLKSHRQLTNAHA